MNKAGIPFLILGGICIIAGGLISAVAAASPSYIASWAVAYIVLVAGVAQLILGIGQAQLASTQPPVWLIVVEVIALNLANVAVLIGSLAELRNLSYIGAALLVIALVLFVWAVRGHHSRSRLLLWAFRVIVVVLAVTAPIGLVIAHSRMG
ncbi:MAG: hypothetical protein ABI400_15065 [Lacisediminihabitans sp.]